MREKSLIGFYSFGALFLLAGFSLGNLVTRNQSGHLLFAFITIFISYLFLLQKKEHWKLLLALGIITRATLFFSLPVLSDDLYRFIWDGVLLKNGVHPFAELPSYYLDYPVDGLSKDLYQRLNSPEYFTIYPPLNQALFWLSVQFDTNWLVSANIIRVFLLLSDIGSFFLLRKLLTGFQRDPNLALWYFLNPLVILEMTGNLHFEGLVVFFVLLGLLGYQQKNHLASVSGFGLAIGTKLLPVIYLPFLFLAGLRNRVWWVPVVAGVVGILTLLPMLDETFISGMSASLDLYFRKFEFNASIYFIAREIGYWIYGYNNIATIGPLLSMISTFGILVISLVAALKGWSYAGTMLALLSTYLLFGTIIHPWYTIPLIAFGLLSRYWFPMLWSFMIFLTYMGYSATGFELPLWIVVVEYATVFVFAMIEIKRHLSV